MSNPQDISQTLQQKVSEAASEGRPLRLTGGNTKAFYGRECSGDELPIASHSGIVSYEPKELVLTARAGTTLKAIESALSEQSQMLPFEPPHFGDSATLGGTIACGFSGPRRPFAGSARDFVLGVRIINGNGEILRFGGEVMKNVAGYDVSRLMTGALGTLGVLLDISLKVLPTPAEEITLAWECPQEQAIETMNRWASTPLPISAACYDGNQLYFRLSGTPKGVAAGKRKIGGDVIENSVGYWESIREQSHPFFSGEEILWRLSLPPGTAPISISGRQLIDWGGAQRWLISDAAPETIWDIARQTGGQATLFRGGDRASQRFQPLPGPLMKLHQSLKQAFDPNGILNPGRLYGEL